MSLTAKTVLVLDTCNRWLVLGLYGDNIVAERALLAPRAAFQTTVPLIREMLTGARLSRPDLIIATIGPGSFTGTRICVSTARNLAQLWNVPVLGVESLRFYCFDMARQRRAEIIKNQYDLIVLIEGKQEKVYAGRLPFRDADLDVSACTGFTMADAHPLNVILECLEHGGRPLAFADVPAVRELYTRKIELTMKKINSTKMDRDYGYTETDAARSRVLLDAAAALEFQLMNVPAPRALYELGEQMLAHKEPVAYDDLRPVYLREDPAHAKYPAGFRHQ